MDLYYIKDNLIHLHGGREDGCIPRNSLVLDSKLSTCDCDLFCKLKVPVCQGKEYIIHRCHKGKRRTLSEMHNILYAILTKDWQMRGREIVHRFMNNQRDALRKRVESMESPNQIKIRPYTQYAAAPRSEFLVYPRYLLRPYQRFDHWYFNHISGYKLSSSEDPGVITVPYLVKHVWQEVKENTVVIQPGVEWVSNKVETLQILAARKVSYFNKTFGGCKQGPNANFTLNNLEDKVPTLLKKYQKHTHTLQPYAQLLASLTGEAMLLLYDKLDVSKYKETQVFSVEKSMEKVSITYDTSAGNGAGIQRHVKDLGNIRIIYTVNGKKCIQEERAMLAVRMIIEDIRAGRPIKLLDRAWVITYKSEVLFAQNGAEQIKFPNKVRIYLIPTTTFYIISSMVHGYRQVIERGDLIQIGINWWSGGAFRFASRFRYNSKTHIRCEGDFRGLDTTIKYHYLTLYSVMSDYYYKRNEGDYDVFKALIKLTAANLAVRTTHVHAGLWRMMIGMMPSGAYETSHGDSWIVALIFYQYFVYTMRKYPEQESTILEALKTNDIDLAIFGDDFHWMIPIGLHDYMNIDKLHEFVSDFLEMEMRDTSTLYSFLSVPNNVTGTLTKTGATYLSRYFISSDDLDVNVPVNCSKVLPYRSANKTIPKFAFGLGYSRNMKDHILASIGMAYDTFGTNPVSYQFCKFMFEDLMSQLGEDINYLEEYMNSSGRDISGVLRKVGISPDKLKNGFPSRMDLLSMHELDETKHLHRAPPTILPNLVG